MSWHPSRASRRPLDPAVPSRYRSATVRSRAGRSMLVELDDGHDRLLSVPAAPLPSLVGSTVLLANDYDWVVAVEPSDPVETVAVAEGDEVLDLTRVEPTPVARVAPLPPVDDEFDEDLHEVDLTRFDRRIEHLQRRRQRGRVTTFRKMSW